jgi:tetratricopeptide (TPR) repeat protein
VDGWPEINMANNYAALGELDQAEQWFRRALTRGDTARSVNEYAGYLNDFAWFLATNFKTDKKRVEEALALSLVSNKLLDYSYPNYLDTLAECFAARGDIELAVKTQRAALDLLPEDSPKRDQYKKRLSEFESKLKK